MELHCQTSRGSTPIIYRFYHEDVTLGHSTAPSGGGVSFNLSLTAEHSGNYSCEADNGQSSQHSEVVTLKLTGPVEDSNWHPTPGVVEGLLSCLGLISVALLCCYWLKRKIGRHSGDPHRSPPRSLPPRSNYLNSPDSRQLQPLYENVNVVHGNEIYSLVYHIQQEEPAAAEHFRTYADTEVSTSMYSRPRKLNIAEVDYEDTM